MDQFGTVDTVEGSPGVYTTTLSVGTITMYHGESLTITIGTGFPDKPSTTVTRVQFYDVSKSNKLGTWNRGGTDTSPAGITVTESGDGFKIQDAETAHADDFYYDVQATDPARTYDADPELVVKKGQRPPQGGSTTPEATP